MTPDQGGERNLRFNVSGLSHEKDILWQHYYYRRGLLFKENDKYQEAGLAFTMALEKGTYFDPLIRKELVEELYHMMVKFGILNQARELKHIYQRQQKPKKSILCVFNYDIGSNKEINTEIVKWIGRDIEPENQKLGAMVMNTDDSLILDIEERDFAAMDIDHLLVKSQREEMRSHFYDVVLKGFRLFDDKDTEKYIITFVKTIQKRLGASVLIDLDEIEDKQVHLIAVQLDDPFPADFEDYIENKEYSHIICHPGTPHSQSFANITKVIFERKEEN